MLDHGLWGALWRYPLVPLQDRSGRWMQILPLPRLVGVFGGLGLVGAVVVSSLESCLTMMAMMRGLFDINEKL